MRTDDLLKESPQLAPYRPEVGIDPELSDAELVTLAVMQALCGFTSEARWLRHAHAHLRHLFPYLPQQPGYNKRLRAAASLIRHCIRVLAAGSQPYGPMTSGWLIPPRWSAAVPARPPGALTWPDGLNTGTAPAIRAISGACGCTWSCTLQGLPVAFALAGAKADEREVLAGMFDRRSGPARQPARPDADR